jgi:hypothetical protein
VTDNFITKQAEQDDLLSVEIEACKQEVQNEWDADEMDYQASSDEEKRVFRYVRHTLRIEDELERAKRQYELIRKQLENKAKALEYMHGAAVRATVTTELRRRSTPKKPCRSWKTPFGTVGLRSVGGGLGVVSEEALLEAARTNKSLGGCIKVEYRPLVTKLTEYMESTGEIPPGCALTDKSDKFYVK